MLPRPPPSELSSRPERSVVEGPAVSLLPPQLRPSSRKNPRVHRHSSDSVHSDRVQGINLPLLANPTSHNQLPFRNPSQPLRHLDGKSLHRPFPIDMGIKKSATIRLQLRNSLISRKLYPVLPPL